MSETSDSEDVHDQQQDDADQLEVDSEDPEVRKSNDLSFIDEIKKYLIRRNLRSAKISASVQSTPRMNFKELLKLWKLECLALKHLADLMFLEPQFSIMSDAKMRKQMEDLLC